MGFSDKLVAPNTRIDFIPLSAVADPTVGPTLTELNASAINISCAIDMGYTLRMTKPDVDNSVTICDEGNSDNQTNINYEGSILFYRDNNVANSASVFNVAYALFVGGPVAGIFTQRIGRKSSVAFAAGQRINWFSGETDYVIHPSTDSKTPTKFQVDLIPDGNADTEKTL